MKLAAIFLVDSDKNPQAATALQDDLVHHKEEAHTTLLKAELCAKFNSSVLSNW
jgi:hypothetical protein